MSARDDGHEAPINLVLWRHAQADDGYPDLDRELTAKGRRQAQRMARWLDARLPDDTRFLTSPAVRARQTAQALRRTCAIDPRISLGATVADLLKAAEWPTKAGTVLLVGHQPTLGNVIAALLQSSAPNWSVPKGSVTWLAARVRSGQRSVVLRAMLPANWV